MLEPQLPSLSFLLYTTFNVLRHFLIAIPFHLWVFISHFTLHVSMSSNLRTCVLWCMGVVCVFVGCWLFLGLCARRCRCVCACVRVSCVVIHTSIHLSGRQGDAADQNLRIWKKMQGLKKQFASRLAPPGQPVPNPFDDSQTDEETKGGEGDSEEEGCPEGDAEPGDHLPRLKDIAQVHLFFDFPCICFCLVCFQHSMTFLPQVAGDRHEQSVHRLGFLDTVISFLFVCVIDS